MIRTDYIERIETDTPRRFNLNVSNEMNAIANLPTDACVEVPVLVGGTGFYPVRSANCRHNSRRWIAGTRPSMNSRSRERWKMIGGRSTRP